MKWIDLKDRAPTKGQKVYFKLNGLRFKGEYRGIVSHVDECKKSSDVHFFCAEEEEGMTNTTHATHWCARKN